MQIRAKFVNEAKDGKKFGSIVGEDDTRYPCPAALVGQFVKGHVYEVTIKHEKWDDKPVQVIAGLTPLTPANQPSAPQTGGAGVSGHANGDKWFMPFVSNTVAHAIDAKLITDPVQIKQWAAAAKQAAQELA